MPTDLHCDPTKRHDFVLLFDVTNGNPNGDPDAGNLPRVDPETMRGIVTDVCIKRKVRDYVASVLGQPIFIQSQTALNTLYNQALETARDKDGKPVGSPLTLKLEENATLKPLLEREEIDEWLRSLDVEGLEFDPTENVLTYAGELQKSRDFSELMTGDDELSAEISRFIAAVAPLFALAAKNKPKLTREARGIVKEDLRTKYFDIRMFGAVLTAGTNAGQIRGPLQLTFATSVDPIQPLDIPITRVAITKPSDLLRKQTEMGRKSIVPYGLYRLHGFYNPFLAKRGSEQIVRPDDLSQFWEALEHVFIFDRSAAKGEMSVRGLYVFTHDCDKGNAHSHRLFSKIKIPPQGKPVRQFADYAETMSVPPEGEVSGFPGVTLKHIVQDELIPSGEPNRI